MEWLKNNLAIISVYLITVGIVYLTAYYSYFEINISSYLDLSEVIQLQFKYFAVAFCCIIFTNIQTVLKITSTFSTRNNIKDEKEDIYNELLMPNNLQRSNNAKLVEDFNKEFLDYPLIYFCLSFIAIFIYKAIFAHYISFPAIEMVALIIIIRIIIKSLPKYKELLKSFGVDKASILASTTAGLFVIISIAFTFEIARKDAFNLIVKRSENEVELLFDNKSIITNDSLVFVGKTKNYVFLYNRFKNQAQVYPFSSIKSIKYKPGKEYNNIPYGYKVDIGKIIRNEQLLKYNK